MKATFYYNDLRVTTDNDYKALIRFKESFLKDKKTVIVGARFIAEQTDQANEAVQTPAKIEYKKTKNGLLGLIKLQFCTIDYPATEWIKFLYEKFPTLLFHLDYYDTDNQNKGEMFTSYGDYAFFNQGSDEVKSLCQKIRETSWYDMDTTLHLVKMDREYQKWKSRSMVSPSASIQIIGDSDELEKLYNSFFDKNPGEKYSGQLPHPFIPKTISEGCMGINPYIFKTATNQFLLIEFEVDCEFGATCFLFMRMNFPILQYHVYNEKYGWRIYTILKKGQTCLDHQGFQIVEDETKREHPLWYKDAEEGDHLNQITPELESKKNLRWAKLRRLRI